MVSVETAEITPAAVELPRLVKVGKTSSLKEIWTTGERTGVTVKSAKQADPRYDMYFEVANLRLGRNTDNTRG